MTSPAGRPRPRRFAVAGLDEYLRARYLNAAAESLFAPLKLAADEFSDGPGAERNPLSYARAVRRFQNALEGAEGVAPYLKKRFDEWAAQTGSPGRRIGLFAELKEEGYDLLIEQTPGIRQINEQARRGGGVNWKRIEQDVLEKLSKSKDESWNDATNLGALAMRLCVKDGQDIAPDISTLHRLADALAGACEAVLEGFVANTTALDEFRKKADEQSVWLDFFRKYSLPYTQFAGGIDAAPAQAPATPLLGISDGGNERARDEFVQTLTTPKGYSENSVVLSGLDVLGMKDDAIVLLHEKPGLPLCYYKGLEDLGKLYEKSVRVREAHYDYRNLNHLLPEIRLADHDRQVTLAEAIRNTILGIMTRRILFDPDRERYILIRGQGAAAIRTPVGSQFVNVANHLALNAQDQERLRASINVWIEEASRNDGGPLVALWCAVQRMREDVRQRVEFLAGESSNHPHEDHSLLLLLNNKLEPEIRGRLQAIRDALPYLDSDLDWNRTFEDPEAHAAIPRLFAKWKAKVDPFFDAYIEEVIPVLRKDARPEAAAYRMPPALNVAPGQRRRGTAPDTEGDEHCLRRRLQIRPARAWLTMTDPSCQFCDREVRPLWRFRDDDRHCSLCGKQVLHLQVGNPVPEGAEVYLYDHGKKGPEFVVIGMFGDRHRADGMVRHRPALDLAGCSATFSGPARPQIDYRVLDVTPPDETQRAVLRLERLKPIPTLPRNGLPGTLILATRAGEERRDARLIPLPNPLLSFANAHPTNGSIDPATRALHPNTWQIHNAAKDQALDLVLTPNAPIWVLKATATAGEIAAELKGFEVATRLEAGKEHRISIVVELHGLEAEQLLFPGPDSGAGQPPPRSVLRLSDFGRGASPDHQRREPEDPDDLARPVAGGAVHDGGAGRTELEARVVGSDRDAPQRRGHSRARPGRMAPRHPAFEGPSPAGDPSAL